MLTQIEQVEAVILDVLWMTLCVSSPNDQHVPNTHAGMAHPRPWHLSPRLDQAHAERSALGSGLRVGPGLGDAAEDVEVILDGVLYEPAKNI